MAVIGFVSLFCVSVLIASAQYPGDLCRLPRFARALCTHISRCHFAIRGLRMGIIPITCSFDRNEPVVCCPYHRTIITPPVIKDKNPIFVEIPTEAPPTTTTSTTTTEAYTSTIEPGSTAKQKCDEYYNGVSITNFLGPTVVGGTKSLNKEFPHMAALGFGDSNNVQWLCGGSLISERFVVTAAHCLYSQTYGDVRYVRLGDLDLQSDTDDAQPQDFLITERFANPTYAPPQQYGDIALLRLDRDAILTPYVRPICLQTGRDLPSFSPIATGWGKLQFGGELSDVLMKVTLKYFTTEECRKTYENVSTRKLPVGIDEETQVCAGGRNEEKDTCQGDSGGPLQVFTGRFYLVGITSFGKGCGSPNTPGVYTRVSHYVPWIERVVWGA